MGKKVPKGRTKQPSRCARWIPLLYKFFTSSPEEYKIIKGILGFFCGFLLGIVFHFAVLRNLVLPSPLDLILQWAFILSFAIGFAVSSQVRCILILVIPTIFGKNGRAYIGTFALVYLLKGPARNLILNSGEINRSISCGSELGQNLTKARADLRTQPLNFIMDDMKEQAHKVHEVTSEVQTAFKPAEVEVHDEKETSDLQKRTHEVDQTQKDADRVNAIENKYKKREKSNESSEKVEAKYEKKVDYRCEDVFSLGVESCRQVFKETELKCLDKLGVVGKLLCLPLKLTVLCEIVRLIPGATGMSCDAMDAVNPGFGESFDTAENSAEALDKNFDVNIQYKVVKNPEVLSKLTVDEVTQSIKYEFEWRKQWIDFVFSIFQNILAFMFLRVLWSAYSYNKQYTMDFRHDNFYITDYFRHIDQRRREQKKVTLIPLKKLEEKTVISPASMKMSKVEKSSLSMGSLLLLMKMFFIGIIVFVDKVMFEILMIINRNSKVEYEQKGIHRVDVNVHGTGAMAHLIRTMLKGFDQEHHINQEVSNQKCLPQPSKTEQSILITLLIIYIIAWLILIFQAYGLRLRRAIAAFFYHKREKKRVLYLYNDMLKKRKGFLRHTRTIIRRRAKERKLEGEIGIFHILAKRCKTCPGLRRFLRKLGKKQMNCLICKERLNKKSVQCDTKGCNFAYCSTCWKDIGRDCYACRNDEDWTSSDSSDHFEVV